MTKTDIAKLFLLAVVMILVPIFIGASADEDQVVPTVPPVEQKTLSAAQEVPDMNFWLHPPSPSTDERLIALNVAAEVAWNEGGPADASESFATMALLEAPTSNIPLGKPVWIVTYPDVCIPARGLSKSELECAGTELNVAIDGVSGDYMFSYSYR